ncbi:MAG: succinylglutamate desuccinylase/aspartoacylase family protein [Haloarculaceae archaeon]|jgi:predicted deacylase
MRVEQLGDGDPEIAVVGGIHGDEPCGVTAIETLLSERPAVERPVRLVVANEEALAAGERYLDDDLNRSFPGETDADSHEKRLAARLTDVLEGCVTVSLHSTQSYEDMFAIVNGMGDFERHVCPRLSVDAVVNAGAFDRGRLFASVDRLIEIECGYQGSDAAAENATRVARDFMSALGAIPSAKRERRGDMPVYRLTRQVPKRQAKSYEVYASNFEHVPAGRPFAAADDEEFALDEGFYPVLMSPYGYEEVFGYAAERVGTVRNDSQ